MVMQKRRELKGSAARLVYSAVCLALCLVLPFLTGQIPQLGSALCPMHFPVLIAGFVCGPWWALAVGLIAPLLRHVIFGMPPLLTAIAMAAELAAYGLISGLMDRILPKKTVSIYAALVTAMVVGRLVWGSVYVLFAGLGVKPFGWTLFLSGAVLEAVPGIILQLILIPVIVLALKRTKLV